MLSTALDPVTVSVHIARPREEVFDYLADIANHPEFSDHYLVDWHLTREKSYGRGAGARFKVKAPLQRFPWADVTLAEVERPYRIVEKGRFGKYNRIRTLATWTLTPAPGGNTLVEYTYESDTRLPTDRILENFAGRGWHKRRATRALRRLQSILEEDRDRGARITLAGR